MWEPEPSAALQEVPRGWQDTHVSECQHNASDDPSHHHHDPQDTEEARARGEVHLAEREKEAPCQVTAVPGTQ